MLSNRGHRLHILHPRFFKAKRPYGLVFVASFNDNNGSGQKKKRKKTSHCCNKNVPVLCILYVSKQHNQCRIYTRQCLKKHNMVPQLYCDLLFTQRAFLLWLSYATCHWNVFFMFLISLNVKHLLLREPNPSDDFSTPLKWKWRMWQNSGINIIKEFDLQKPQHLLGWGE